MITKGVFDIESNGFLRELDHLHCIVIQDYESLEVFVYHDHPGEFHPHDGLLRDGIEVLNNLDVTIAHNQKNFDVLAMRKCREDYNPKDSQVSIDTLALSRLLYPEMNGHSIEAWAKRLKLEDQKVQNEDWTHLTQLMLDRCISDVIINTQLNVYLWATVEKQEKQTIGVEGGDSYQRKTNWYQALMTEQEVFEIHGEQVLHGVLYDVPQAHRTLKVFDKELQILNEKITKEAPPVMSVPGVSKVLLDEYREVAKWTFVKPEALHQGVVQPFLKVKPKVISKYTKKDGTFTVQAAKVFQGVSVEPAEVCGEFCCYTYVPVEDRINNQVKSWFPKDYPLDEIRGPFSKLEFHPVNLYSDPQSACSSGLFA